MRVHIVQPSPVKPPVRQERSRASKVAADRRRDDIADRQRRQIEILWITHGGQ